jgi:hypothetical protein
MRTYRYKVQTNAFGLFLGITAEATRLDTAPTIGNRLSDRVWLDTSQVHNAYRGEPLTLSERESAWLEFGLLKVTSGIEAQATGHVLITLQALEIVDADYAEATLAPALARWTEEEFGLPLNPGHVTRDSTTGEFTFGWDQ